MEIGVDLTEGTRLRWTHTTGAIPPKLRRFVLHRDQGCTVADCTSRYRLQPHRVIPASEGGPSNPENLATSRWFHHHVVVHWRGYRINPGSPQQRRRFLRPLTERAPPH